jgi:hypothetical protein
VREMQELKVRRSIVMSVVSLAAPVRPSDKGSVEVKTLGWLEAVALGQRPRDLNFLN